ncbi:MAG: hypothetical protein IJ007_01480 [Oscillospiraceae bacterium]|nr:hypothetical protein [Oscillospiraceae bacterium]
MHNHNRIFKFQSYNYDNCEPVKIDNTIYVPQEEPEEEDGEFISQEEILRREQEEKEAEERRFQEAVKADVSRILAAKRSELEQERARVIEAARGAAKAMTDEAKAATAAVLERANKECSILKEKAKAEGFKEGFDEGKRQSLEKCSKYVDATAQLLSDINAHKNGYYLENEKELRDTLFVMVEKIVKAELKTAPEMVERIIADAAKGFRNSDYIKISVADGEITRKLKTDEKLIKEIIPYIADIEIEILPDAEQGTVILDNNEEIVDASVPTQLEFLKEIMRNTRGENQDDNG